MSADVFIGSGYGGGMVTLNVTNNAQLPFINITLSAISPPVNGLLRFTPFTINDRVVTSSNALDVGKASIGYFSFDYGGTSPTVYTLTVTATTVDGQLITEQTTAVSYSWT